MKVTAIMAAYPREWIDLFARLIKHKVTDWHGEGEGEYIPAADRFEVADTADADTVASIIKDPTSPVLGEKMGAYDHKQTFEEMLGEQPANVYKDGDYAARHVLLIDIDHPAYLVPSTTPGHHHLYVEVPDGIPDADYWPLIAALAKAGVIEDGYFKASEARGFTAARLPWIMKPAPEAENETTAVLNEDDDLLEDL